MSQELLLIILIILAGFTLLYLLLKKQLELLRPKEDNTLMEWVKSTQAEITNLQKTLTSSVTEGSKSVNDTLLKSYDQLHERLEKTAKVMADLKDETGRFSEIGRSMQDLQQFLNSPKLRGNIGERVLMDLLKQHFPSQHLAFQYRFKSGDTVDAVIKTEAGLIPIDSKFPMENYLKINKEENLKDKEQFQKAFINDVKKHIRDISSKYIKTNENTLDFALMYIPSESMYYEIAATIPDLHDYSQEKRVLPVSPATFYAFIRTILISFEGQRIAKEAQNILNSLRDIQKNSGDFRDKLSTLQKHITNANNNMNQISTDYDKLHTKIEQTGSLTLPEKDLLN